ncbi:uncharacterized protein BDR25DRAFT_350060 [Lindgomyces ingoldianus]|uniref:Uncharacterized protein n=1 Tax=Lindgomyces ingoldianus TaxID=673940 RepID=A0ACB6R8X2_9PLEO|nr:uncharacterized protein BDR25DRAFT_350060 [Lindgomyces ingoldianus]KAF2475774.1 hypothetical protein BDR25DRAFT_350060 [Lindgomyces ingoldianus]
MHIPYTDTEDLWLNISNLAHIIYSTLLFKWKYLLGYPTQPENPYYGYYMVKKRQVLVASQDQCRVRIHHAMSNLLTEFQDLGSRLAIILQIRKNLYFMEGDKSQVDEHERLQWRLGDVSKLRLSNRTIQISPRYLSLILSPPQEIPAPVSWLMYRKFRNSELQEVQMRWFGVGTWAQGRRSGLGQSRIYGAVTAPEVEAVTSGEESFGSLRCWISRVTKPGCFLVVDRLFQNNYLKFLMAVGSGSKDDCNEWKLNARNHSHQSKPNELRGHIEFLNTLSEAKRNISKCCSLIEISSSNSGFCTQGTSSSVALGHLRFKRPKSVLIQISLQLFHVWAVKLTKSSVSWAHQFESGLASFLPPNMSSTLMFLINNGHTITPCSCKIWSAISMADMAHTFINQGSDDGLLPRIISSISSSYDVLSTPVLSFQKAQDTPTKMIKIFPKAIAWEKGVGNMAVLALVVATRDLAAPCLGFWSGEAVLRIGVLWSFRVKSAVNLSKLEEDQAHVKHLTMDQEKKQT